MAVAIKNTTFWDVIPCYSSKANRRFGGKYLFRLQGRGIIQVIWPNRIIFQASYWIGYEESQDISVIDQVSLTRFEPTPFRIRVQCYCYRNPVGEGRVMRDPVNPC
jgi:hypothetical protein